MKKPKDRAAIVRAIRLTYESLESHLDYSVDAKELCPACGDQKHQIRCVREYSEIIKTLADLL